MRALTYLGGGKTALQDHAKPEMTKPTDAIVRVTRTTICGTDLKILKGDVPSCVEGCTLGHEGVGIIEQIGPAVTAFSRGDHVVISSITSCAKCTFCRKGMYSHCLNGGWLLGHTIDGTHAEFVRVPYADTSLHAVPSGADEDAMMMLSEVLPTGFECGAQAARVQPGNIVVILGAGPVGLASLLAARLYSPAKLIVVDVDVHRLEIARSLGATDVIDNGDGRAANTVMKLTFDHGADAAIEAVGSPATFELCEKIITPGGTISNIGLHGVQVPLHLEHLWDRNITITTRLVDTVSTPQLIDSVTARQLNPTPLVTHHFRLDRIVDAYETFANAAREKALKVSIQP